jgi:hypothetical protein
MITGVPSVYQLSCIAQIFSSVGAPVRCIRYSIRFPVSDRAYALAPSLTGLAASGCEYSETARRQQHEPGQLEGAEDASSGLLRETVSGLMRRNKIARAMGGNDRRRSSIETRFHCGTILQAHRCCAHFVCSEGAGGQALPLHSNSCSNTSRGASLISGRFSGHRGAVTGFLSAQCRSRRAGSGPGRAGRSRDAPVRALAARARERTGVCVRSLLQALT